MGGRGRLRGTGLVRAVREPALLVPALLVRVRVLRAGVLRVRVVRVPVPHLRGARVGAVLRPRGRRVLDRWGGCPRARAAVGRGAVGVGIVQGLGARRSGPLQFEVPVTVPVVPVTVTVMVTVATVTMTVALTRVRVRLCGNAIGYGGRRGDGGRRLSGTGDARGPLQLVVAPGVALTGPPGVRRPCLGRTARLRTAPCAVRKDSGVRGIRFREVVRCGVRARALGPGSAPPVRLRGPALVHALPTPGPRGTTRRRSPQTCRLRARDPSRGCGPPRIQPGSWADAQRAGSGSTAGVGDGEEEGDGVAAGAAGSPGVEVSVSGWASVSGRMSGDVAAAPATTGVVSVCVTSWPRPAGAGTPGSSGADTAVGATGPLPSARSPWASTGPTDRRRPDSGAVGLPVPWERDGVTLLPAPAPPRASGVSPGIPVDTPPSATAASDTAPAAAKANRSPREADRSAS